MILAHVSDSQGAISALVVFGLPLLLCVGIVGGIWWAIIGWSVRRDERKGRCGGCGGRGSIPGPNSNWVRCTSCSGTGKYTPYNLR
ncbi:hypothetical protein [Actinoplanes ianthinogenes]|nr:hypothetical protein [Actinoplanes ianthinogenes]